MAYFKIDRKLLGSDLWLSESFSSGQAWIDLIGLANYADRERSFRGQVQQIKRGELVVSKLWLAQRWRWSEGKVRRFLARIQKEGMVKLESKNTGTVIRICNYERYQGMSDTQRTDERTNQRTNRRVKSIENSTLSEDTRRTDERENRRTDGGHKEKEQEGNKKKGEKIEPSPPLAYGSYKNVIMTQAEYDDLKRHIPVIMFEERIEKASRNIHNGNKGYKGSHYEAVKHWAITDECWKEHVEPTANCSILEQRRREFIETLGRDTYERTIATVGTDDPKAIKEYLERKQ